MATGPRVWGIDVGQSALKALRCALGEDGETIVADAFDYIEYPKILSQPDAEPEVLVAEALQQFLSRNKVIGDQVAVAVSGQAGLARFIKLPPVDSSKIPDIVKYEARQQIPFPLDEVIWDYQQLAGGTEEDGFALETEVGLFAMKREQVFRAIKPYEDAGMELDLIQLAPLAIYNMTAFDMMKELPPADQYDPDNPPESMVVLSLGTDTSDLVITNGYRVWQRSIPLGGNHFTRQLTKELKLTFAKAEHLKRNAGQSEDPKAVFQAMRPVFNDLVTEVQRSVGYFQSIDRNAKIGRLLMLGNTVKLPGLLPYLGKNLGTEVVNFKGFNQLTGKEVIASPTFSDNVASFAVAYGLCVQGLKQGKLSTSLLPREIVNARIIKEKKPWAAAAAGMILLALAFHFFFVWNKWYSAEPRRAEGSTTWSSVLGSATAVKQDSDRRITEDKAALTEFERLKELGRSVIKTDENRVLWLELLKAINAGLPYDKELSPGEIPKKPLAQRQQLHITRIEAQFFNDLKEWWTEDLKAEYEAQRTRLSGGTPPATDPAAAPLPAPATPDPMGPMPPPMAAAPAGDPNAPAAEDAGPEGRGWVIEIEGYHFYNTDVTKGQHNFLFNTLVKHLAEGSVALPGAPANRPFTMKELGIGYPVVTYNPPLDRSWREPNPDYVPPIAGAGGVGLPDIGRPAIGGGAADESNPETIIVPKYSFRVQFCWKETPLSVRLEKREAEDAKLEAERKAAEEAAGTGPMP